MPSLDTPVCDAQTKRFNEEAAKLPGVEIFTISMDLPFAQKRWCGAFGIDKIKMLSDHKSGSFGEHYGTLIKELRIESRAIFVLDKDNTIKHVEYVKEVADHPNYDAALNAARSCSQVAHALCASSLPNLPAHTGTNRRRPRFHRDHRRRHRGRLHGC